MRYLKPAKMKPKDKLFLVFFTGTVMLGDEEAQPCPFPRRTGLPDDYDEIADMQPGDTFDFTEATILKAKTRREAHRLAEALIKNRHEAHWTDCAWSYSKKDLRQIRTLDGLVKAMGVVTFKSEGLTDPLKEIK